MFNQQQYNKDYYQAHKKKSIGYRKILCKRGHTRAGDNLTAKGACKQCTIIHQRTWRAKNPQSSKNYARKQKLKLIELAGGKCQCCGYNAHPSAMDFDHIDPVTKTTIRSLANVTLVTAIKELEGRMLLCANCHRIKTYEPELFATLLLYNC